MRFLLSSFKEDDGGEIVGYFRGDTISAQSDLKKKIRISNAVPVDGVSVNNWMNIFR